MTSEPLPPTQSNADRRQQRGTWPWFVLNVILFPAPAHLTLLRARDTRFGQSLRHLGITFVLFLVLLAAGVLQVVAPAIGRLWMLLPFLTGVVVLYASRRLKDTFKPFDFKALTHTHLTFILFCILAFTVISVLPDLDLVGLDNQTAESLKSWLGVVPVWQDLLILVTALLVMIAGYVTNTTAPVSINRAVILFACFIVFSTLLGIGVFFAYSWLKVPGGAGTQLVFVLLSAVLAIDYWDARTFGQYTRRFFFLTLTKGLSFVYVWMCFLGLPQQGAANLAAHYYDSTRPAAIAGLDKYLVFPKQGRFTSAHNAARHIRARYAEALDSGKSESLHRLDSLLKNAAGPVLPADADICRMAEWARRSGPPARAAVFQRVPLFRPIDTDWDVMLAALVFQGTISTDRLNEIVADFKAMLPESSEGRLPSVNLPHKARYVAKATGTQVDFIPPRLELLTALLEKRICPVLSLRLAGRNYWAALLEIDAPAGIAWFRIETPEGTEKSIQTRFDADESAKYRQEILSRVMMPLPLTTLNAYLQFNSRSVLVFTPAGLAAALPDHFTEKDLNDVHGAVAFIANPTPLATTVADASGESAFARYAAYTRTVAAIRRMLHPAPFDERLFSATGVDSTGPAQGDRLEMVGALIDQVGGLRAIDRVDIADDMARNNHVRAAPALFVRLAADGKIASDLVDCSVALRIGRELFLLGHHEDANRYLDIAYLRHPFSSEYALWRAIAGEKLNKPPERFLSPPEHEPHLNLYYQTLADIRNGSRAAAKKRLETALEKDSHDSLALHLMNVHFGRPLDERQYFPAQEGL